MRKLRKNFALVLKKSKNLVIFLIFLYKNLFNCIESNIFNIKTETVEEKNINLKQNLNILKRSPSLLDELYFPVKNSQLSVKQPSTSCKRKLGSSSFCFPSDNATNRKNNKNLDDIFDFFQKPEKISSIEIPSSSNNQRKSIDKWDPYHVNCWFLKNNIIFIFSGLLCAHLFISQIKF